MFNKDFYPTPTHVIEQMLAGIYLHGKTVLEPSAGNGNIVDFCIGSGANLLACELNKDLSKIVERKCSFLKHDFMQVQAQEISHIDFIIMNPPFSADERHILHAWEIAPSGCEIISLCNWDTIDNTYSSLRRNLKYTIENNGTAINLGDVFSDAERKTGVNIGMVKLYKPGTQNDFDGYFTDESDDPELQENGIMSYNVIREVVQRYVNAVKLYDEVLSNAVKMNALVGEFNIGSLSFTCKEDDKEKSKSDFVKNLQKKAWGWIFSKMNMDKYVTQSLKADINRFVEQQTNVPFTMKNIYKMIEIVAGTHGQRMQKAIIEVFDSLTSRYNENRYQVEGWKTNSHYLVNKKFIHPYVARIGFSGQPELSWGSHAANQFEDLQKALCYITGIDYNSLLSLQGRVTSRRLLTKKGKIVIGSKFNNLEAAEMFLINNPDQGYGFTEPVRFGEWFDWNFFEVKLFKKGTGHFKFKDENVWALFNQKVAEAKGFELPENLKNTA